MNECTGASKLTLRAQLAPERVATTCIVRALFGSRGGFKRGAEGTATIRVHVCGHWRILKPPGRQNKTRFRA